MSSVDKILPVLDDATVRKTIVSQNLLGEGLFKRCFRIPDMPDFVLAVNKKDFHPNELIKPFVATENKFGDFNLGQTVAYSPSGLIIMKRVYGQPHGVSEWAKKLIAFNNGIPLRVVDAKKFYAQIANVASHKLASYEHLAMQLKKLCEYNVRADINPNNVLVDNERGQFNIIDFEDLNNDNNFDFSKLPRPINGVNDMQCMLVDMSLHIGLHHAQGLPEPLRKGRHRDPRDSGGIASTSGQAPVRAGAHQSGRGAHHRANRKKVIYRTLS